MIENKKTLALKKKKKKLTNLDERKILDFEFNQEAQLSTNLILKDEVVKKKLI